MRVGIFTDQYYPAVSGVVTSIKMLYEGLESLGHECFIFTSFNEKKLSKKVRDSIYSKKVINIKGMNYPFKVIKNLRFTFFPGKFVKLVAEYNLDVIHVQTEYSISKVAIKASKKLNIPIVHTLHTSWKDYIQCLFPIIDKGFHKQLLWLEKKWFTGPISKASEIEIIPSKKIVQDLSLYGMDNDVEIVPTGIELEMFNNEAIKQEEIADLREKLGINKDDFVFSYVGRTSKEKNIKIIIDAFGDTFKNNNDVKLLIVGGGPSFDDLIDIANRYESTDNIIFTDWVPWEKTPLYYKASNVFINASKTETQGLTYIEALASGTPALVQKDEAIEGVVEEGYNGYIFDGIDDLKSKMKYIYDNKKNIDEIRKNCYNSITKFSKEIFSKRILSIYIKAIENYNGKKEN